MRLSPQLSGLFLVFSRLMASCGCFQRRRGLEANHRAHAAGLGGRPDHETVHGTG